MRIRGSNSSEQENTYAANTRLARRAPRSIERRDLRARNPLQAVFLPARRLLVIRGDVRRGGDASVVRRCESTLSSVDQRERWKGPTEVRGVLLAPGRVAAEDDEVLDRVRAADSVGEDDLLRTWGVEERGVGESAEGFELRCVSSCVNGKTKKALLPRDRPYAARARREWRAERHRRPSSTGRRPLGGPPGSEHMSVNLYVDEVQMG